MPRLLLVPMLGFAFVCQLQADETKLDLDPKIEPEARKEEKPADDKKPKESSTTGSVTINGKAVKRFNTFIDLSQVSVANLDQVTVSVVRGSSC